MESTRTDPTTGLEKPIGDPGWVVGGIETAIRVSGLVTSWNPCGMISELHF